MSDRAREVAIQVVVVATEPCPLPICARSRIALNDHVLQTLAIHVIIKTNKSITKYRSISRSLLTCNRSLNMAATLMSAVAKPNLRPAAPLQGIRVGPQPLPLGEPHRPSVLLSSVEGLQVPLLKIVP